MMLKRTIGCAAAGLLLAGMLGACAAKPAPETPSASKDTQQMIATAGLPSAGEAGQALRESLGAPEHVEEADLPTQLEKFSISISADVTVPDVDHLSVCRVSAAEFSEAFVDAAFQYFCKGDTMYNYANSYDTRDHIQARIDSIQQDLDRNYSPDGDSGDDSWRADYEAEIAELKKQLSNAPEDLGDPIRSAHFSQSEAAGGGTYESFMAVNAQKYPYTKELFAWNNPVYPNDAVQYDAEGNVTGVPHSEATFSYRDSSRVSDALYRQRDVTAEAQVDELATTPAQAMAQAAALLDTLGISDMEPYRVCLARTIEDGEADQYAYYVEARRVVNGVEVQSPFNLTYVGGVDDGQEWVYETLSIRLDDEGIFGMSWTSPLTVGETEVERANLLPFSSILTVATNMLGVVNAPLESDLSSLESYSIVIDHITLSLQRIPNANSVDTGFLIPVWNFYGTPHCIAPYGIEIHSNVDDPVELNDEPFLSVNAIDGSVISKTPGY